MSFGFYRVNPIRMKTRSHIDKKRNHKLAHKAMGNHFYHQLKMELYCSSMLNMVELVAILTNGIMIIARMIWSVHVAQSPKIPRPFHIDKKTIG